MNTTLRAVIALMGILIGPISSASSTVAPRTDEIASQVNLKALKPIASAALIPASEQNHYNPSPPEQYAIARGNNVYIRQGQSLVAIKGTTGRALWKLALPWLFTVWHGTLVTVNTQGIIAAYDVATLKERWRLHTPPNPHSRIGTSTPILRVIGDVLITSGYIITEFSPNGQEIAFGLRPESGRLIWKNNFSLNTPYSTEADRYIIWFPRSDSPLPSTGEPNLIDARTGWQADFDTGTLNRTWSGAESVHIVYPKPPQPDQYPNTDAYDMQVLIRADNADRSLVQDLGLFQLGPRPDCYPQNLPFSQRKVHFLSANDRFVWLRADDECGNRIAQIARASGAQVGYIDWPEKLSLADRQRLSVLGQFTPTGRLNQQQRIAFLNENPVLAKLRADLKPSKLLWSAVQGDRVYAVLKPNELRVLSTNSGKLLNRFSLAVPLPIQPSGSELRMEVIDRILVWRGASGSHFFFLP